MEVWKIVIGLLTAGFLIFLKEAHSKAQKQKIISTRLRSYLLYWQGKVVENDLFNVFYMGVKWNEETDELVSSGADTNDLVDLKEKKKKELSELREHLLSEDGLKSLSKEDIEKIVKKMPDTSTDYILSYAKNSEQNLIDGKTFITDEEASYLGVYVSQVSIELKMELISIMNSAIGMLVLLISAKDDFNYKDHIEEIMKMVWKGMVVSKHIDTLYKKADYFSSRSVLELTFKNLRGEL